MLWTSCAIQRGCRCHIIRCDVDEVMVHGAHCHLCSMMWLLTLHHCVIEQLAGWHVHDGFINVSSSRACKRCQHLFAVVVVCCLCCLCPAKLTCLPCAVQVTVSTVGLVDKLDEFVSRSNACLAISLHATTDEVRDWIVPVNRRHNIRALMAGLEKHYQRGNGEGHRLMIEYTMLKRVNDTLDDAHR